MATKRKKRLADFFKALNARDVTGIVDAARTQPYMTPVRSLA
jgi:hypothetical protein